MSGLLSKIAASEAVNVETEQKLDDLRRTVSFLILGFVYACV